MIDVDYFVMDFFPGSKQLGEDWLERGKIQKVTDDWIQHIIHGCASLGVRLRLQMIQNEPFEDGLDFAVRARQHAFEKCETDIFILSDNDMLPFSAQHVLQGLEVLDEKQGEFAIISAWPQPHTLKPPKTLDDRTPLLDTKVMEHYSCGGFRFCHKLERPLEMPEERKAGYDGVFCRYLWKEHQKRVGYAMQSDAFHLGTHCTSLWGEE